MDHHRTKSDLPHFAHLNFRRSLFMISDFKKKKKINGILCLNIVQAITADLYSTIGNTVQSRVYTLTQ